MAKTWVYADPHFSHANILNFKRHDGSPLREFKSIEEMDAFMIHWYNELVSPEDRVYILGDVAMNRKGLDRAVPSLNGRKVLVKGNHDMDKLAYYSQYFDDVRAYVPKKGFILSHIPIHPGSLGRWNVNIHGHLHYNRVGQDYYDDPNNVGKPDERYECVSVEHTNYRPVLLDDILKRKGLK